jgi:nitroimidazol reductase NimA-like FMN-containing flavoprotein (pyridoxamine 5'-phosphate oxidase superfamily)
MMSRRPSIRMTDDEISAFLADHHTVQVATISPGGMPHLVAMWYGLLGGEVVMWTYAKSQKACNSAARRISRCSCNQGSGTTNCEASR